MKNDLWVYTSRGVVVTTYMVDRRCDPLGGKIGEVYMNITGAEYHAPEV